MSARPYLVACSECGEEKNRPDKKTFVCSKCKYGRKKPPFWTAIRKKVLDRDGKCAVCGDTENLHVHHKDGDRSNNQLFNLQTLCDQCHSSFHQNRGKILIGIKWGKTGKRLMYRSDDVLEQSSARITRVKPRLFTKRKVL